MDKQKLAEIDQNLDEGSKGTKGTNIDNVISILLTAKELENQSFVLQDDALKELQYLWKINPEGITTYLSNSSPKLMEALKYPIDYKRYPLSLSLDVILWEVQNLKKYIK